MIEAIPNLLHDHPALYDAVIPDVERKTARFIHAILRRYDAGRRVLDIGCGLGREVGYLCEQGYDAVGLDTSSAMLAWARQHYPFATFVQAHQHDFTLDQRFDAITCMGSTFLYNYTNDLLLTTLRCFHRHLVTGGLLLLDMRNAAFFLTEEGQQWLRADHREEVGLPEGTLTMLTRFDIGVAQQLLERHYTWIFPNGGLLHEHLYHRLIFPQELHLLLRTSGFEICVVFDEPAPHIGDFNADVDFQLGESLRGRRMQAIARAGRQQ